MVVPEAMNERWSADFMSDALWCSRRFRIFNSVDDFNREALAIEVDFKFAGTKGISGTAGAVEEKGKSLEKQKIAVS